LSYGDTMNGSLVNFSYMLSAIVVSSCSPVIYSRSKLRDRAFASYLFRLDKSAHAL